MRGREGRKGKGKGKGINGWDDIGGQIGFGGSFVWAGNEDVIQCVVRQTGSSVLWPLTVVSGSSGSLWLLLGDIDLSLHFYCGGGFC